MTTEHQKLYAPMPDLIVLEVTRDRAHLAREFRAFADSTHELRVAPRADGMPSSAIERELRRMLCAAYAGSAAYMDDGEAQDLRAMPAIDFMRMEPAEIQAAMQQRGRLRMEQAPALSDEEIAAVLLRLHPNIPVCDGDLRAARAVIAAHEAKR